MNFKSSIFRKVSSNTREILTDKSNRVWILSLIGSAIIGSAITINAYLDYRREAQKMDVEVVEKAIPFPSEGVHYETIHSRDYTENNIELFISLSSKESRSAYKQATKFALENNTELSIYHLSQNPEWELAAKTFHALTSLKPDISLTKYFDMFIALEKESDLNKVITPLLIEDEISTTTFNNTLLSIETIQHVNDDLELSNKLNIDFIPSIILHGNRLIYFGLFDSYKDSLRLYEATKISKIKAENTPKQRESAQNN